MNSRFKPIALKCFSLATLMLLSVIGTGTFVRGDERLQYNRDIRPLLAKNCFVCHGLDTGSRKADLRLDQREAAIKAKAIVPGQPAASELMARIESADPDVVMPPPATGHKLTAAEMTLLDRWIKEGAEYQKHWSFTPPKKAELPATRQSDWPAHPLDYFVLKRLEDAGLAPSAEAERLQLLRRVSLDLTGLPPTVEAADAFLADQSADAYETVVNQLLDSDAFGEHWAQMWLDLARYADTKGYEKDRARTIWRYRDWVIDALNRDMPYDQFTTDQLAGDLLPEPSNNQLLATAFHRNTMENEEGGTDDEEFRVAAVKDRVDTTVQVWMGLTMGCAKCHSHKYDPISQQDYYALYAFFNQTADADREAPTVPTPTAEQQRQIASLQAELKSLEQQLKAEPEGFAQAWKTWQEQFKQRPLWTPLRKAEFESLQGVSLNQREDGLLMVDGELPAKDTWKLMLQLPPGKPVTAIRIDTLPKPAGGKWPDKNVALRELTVELLAPGKPSQKLKLTGARADFSQRGWEVTRAIDGDLKAGWAFSLKAAEPHAAVFDFAEPVEPGEGRQLLVTLEQQYGQGLLFKDFRISASSWSPEWLTADVDPAANLRKLFRDKEYPETKALAMKIDAQRSAMQKVQATIPATPVLRELPPDRQRVTRIHKRGNFLDPGEIVQGAVPGEFGQLAEDWPRNRLGVSRWLMHPENPLTARVAVNRVWARLFGLGIVETEEDFGTQGALPSHPHLLDWLAVDFRENGWSLKQLLKTIVMSRTYRQSSVTTQQHLEYDPRNQLLSRGPRFRLSAEAVRDQALAVSGLLNHRIGGPSVMPPQPGGVWKSTYSGEQWKNATGPDRYRRALYTYKKRTSPYPAMVTFDSGSGEVCQIRRVRTNTPLQALVTLNDTPFLEAAGALATRMQTSGKSPREQIANGFRMVLVRQAEPAELDRLVKLYDVLKDDLADGKALLKSAGLTTGDPRLVAVANVLLNLDETLMKP